MQRANIIKRAALTVISSLLLAGAVKAAPSVPYNSGNPTAEEQYSLELINYARMNPAAEGQLMASFGSPSGNPIDQQIYTDYQYFLTNYASATQAPSTVSAALAAFAPLPPLAMNAGLLNVARAESTWCAANQTETHDGADGDFTTRIASQYNYSAAGENTAFGQGALEEHASYMIDWDVPALDHRSNIMSSDYKEVGVGIEANSSSFGPEVNTEDFGKSANSNQNFIVGVVYNDAAGTGSYQMGEGLAGVTIMPTSGTYFAVTGTAGGYAIPVPANTTSITVTVSGPGIAAPIVRTITLNGSNAKVDFTAAMAGTSGTVNGNGGTTNGANTGGTNAVAASAKGNVVTIARSGSLSAALPVKVKWNGTAIAGVDYRRLPTTVTIPAGAAATNLTVSKLNSPEGMTRFVVAKVKPGSYKISQPRARVAL